MGICVSLRIVPTQIDPEAWAAAFDETVSLLAAWRPRLISSEYREVFGTKLHVYTERLRHADAHEVLWDVCGDRESMAVAESHRVHRTLRAHWLQKAPVTTDVALLAAQESFEDQAGLVQVLGDKTQGFPYHYAVLAAGMLVEARFPGAALVSGDIDRAQAEVARDMAQPILGETLPLPVAVDPERLFRRLKAGFSGAELAKAFVRMFTGGRQEAWQEMLRHLPPADAKMAWLEAFGRHPVGAMGVFYLGAWLNAGFGLAEAGRLICLDPAGPRQEPEAFARLLASTWVTLPERVRNVLSPLLRPPGLAPSVWSRFGEAMLDRRAMGWRTRATLTLDQAEAALADVFGGDQARSLMELVLAEHADVEATFPQFGEALKQLAAEAAEQAGEEPDTLFELEDPAKMRPKLQKIVELLTHGALKTASQVKQKRPDWAISSARIREAIAAIAANRGPVLTNEAWDHLAQEEDPLALELWLGLVLMPSPPLAMALTRRALLERPAIRTYALGLAQDPARRAEIAGWIEAARQEDENKE